MVDNPGAQKFVARKLTNDRCWLTALPWFHLLEGQRTGHCGMPSAWLILLRANTFPPLPLLTLSLPCKSASLRPHFHLNFKKNPFPPQTAGPASVSRPWSLSGLLLFRQLTNDLDSLVNSGTHTHARTHAIAAQPQAWCVRDPRRKRKVCADLSRRTNCSDVCLNARPMTLRWISDH